MSTRLPTPPRVAFVDPQTGLLTRDGAAYIRGVFDRIGGNDAYTNSELAAEIVAITAAANEELIEPVTAGGADNANVFKSKLNESAFDSGVSGIRRRIRTAGNYYIGSLIDVHPSFSLPFDARGGIQVEALSGLPATNADGADAALIRVLRRPPPNPATQAYAPVISGFNLIGNKNVQSNQVHGIRIPNPNPANNPYDPATGFTTNKDFVAGSYAYQDITAFSGSGMVVDAGNGRLDLLSHRALNNALHGYDLGGNDIVFSGHWAAGGNGGFGVKVGQAAGFFAGTGNIWGDSLNRALSVGAMWFNGRKLFSLFSSEFNDWLRMDGNTAFYRGGNVANCVFAQFGANYTDDGVMIDNTPGDSRLQANVGITDYQSLNFIGNTHVRSDKVDFATPYNTGGDLVTGAYGTAPAYLYDVGNNAMVNFVDQVCSAPNVKPWVNNNPATASYLDPTPYSVHGGAQATYFLQDSYRGLTRIGAKGAVHSKLMLGIDETSDGDTNYAIEIGDSTQPSSVKYRNAAYGMWEFNNAVQYGDTAYDARSFTNGLTRTVKAGQAYQYLIVAGAGIAGGTIALPNAQNASSELLVVISGGPVAALTWTGTFNSSSPPPPAATNGFTAVKLSYRHDSDTWHVTGISRTGDPWVTLTDAATIATDSTLGRNFQVTLGGNRTLGNPSNMLDGQRLTWRVTQDGTGTRTLAYAGKFKFAGGAPTLSVAANAIDMINGVYNAALDQIFCTIDKAFA